MTSYRFGVFEFDGESLELRRGGRKVTLAPQPARLLALLLARPGAVVTREELSATLWPEGTHVDFEGGLNQAVRQVRSALRDDALAPRFLETLPKRGYRFLAPLQGEPAAPAAIPRRRLPVVAAVLSILATIGAAFATVGSLAPARPTVAVLPFEVSAGEPRLAAIAQVLTEATTGRLAAVADGAFDVSSRMSVEPLRGEARTLQRAQAELGAHFLLDAKVLRIAEGALVHVKLVRGSDGRLLWTSDLVYADDELVRLQMPLAEALARTVASRVGRRRAALEALPAAEAAADAYLAGRNRMDQAGAVPLHEALPRLERAAVLAPDFAPAHAELARALVRGVRAGLLPAAAFARARVAARQALALAPGEVTAQAALAHVALWADRDPEAARQAFLRCVAADSSHAYAQEGLARAASALGRHAEAIAAARAAVRVSPLGLDAREALVAVLHAAGRKGEAALALAEAQALAPRADLLAVWAPVLAAPSGVVPTS